MATKAPPHTYTAPAAVVDGITEMALKTEQNALHLKTGKRPTMAGVVAQVLTKWGQEYPKAG